MRIALIIDTEKIANKISGLYCRFYGHNYKINKMVQYVSLSGDRYNVCTRCGVFKLPKRKKPMIVKWTRYKGVSK